MATHPTGAELAAAVAGFVERIAPSLPPREAFMARVAQNALRIIGRELKLGPAAEAAARARLRELMGREGSLEELNRLLCEAIRADEFDAGSPGLVATLKASTLDQLAIDQPDYRWRVDPG